MPEYSESVMDTRDEWLTRGSMSTHLKRALVSLKVHLVDIDLSVSHSSQVTMRNSFSPSNQLLFHFEFFN